MQQGLILELEDVSARVWPAAHIERLGEWRLHADRGWSGRANSCWAIGSADRDPAEALQAVEAWFLARGLPTRFKTIEGSPGGAEIETLLEARGYQSHSDTFVMTGPARGSANLDVVLGPLDPTFLDLFGADAEAADAAERFGILGRVAQPVLFARVQMHGVPQAIGACAVADGWAAIMAMRTRLSARRRGHAGRIVGTLLAAATQVGANRAFLQVEEDNLGAVALYRRLGFETAYSYRYWSKV